jgi:hypothetical protein
LESVGVFRCPACGRVNADGELIPDGASEPARFAVSTREGSFAAPPPVQPAVVGTRAAVPTLVIVLMVVQAFLTLLDLAASGGEALQRSAFRLGCLGGIVTGDRTAYRAACLGWLVASVLDVAAMMSWWSTLGAIGHGIFVLVLVLDASFLVALLSPDMRRRYETSPVA